MLSTNFIEAAAKRLWDAAQTGQPCAPVRDLIGETDTETAYAVQAINTARRLAEGVRVVGCKIGLTSPAVQRQFGISQPDFGLLWHDREVWNGGEVRAADILQPRAEAEIAFVMGRDLPSPTLSTAEVLQAVEFALPSLELVGSRIAGWDIRITDTIADNASASHFVLGHRPVRLENLDLINCKMRMEQNGKVVSEGKGSACLGSPINALRWLAQTMARFGSPLRAGDIVLSGALGPMVAAVAGDHFRAEIEGLGEVSVQFT